MSDATLGPTGGSGGQEFSDYAAPAGTTVCELHIFVGNYVDAIQLAYAGPDDVLVRLPKIGGHGLPSAGRRWLLCPLARGTWGTSFPLATWAKSVRKRTRSAYRTPSRKTRFSTAACGGS